MRIRDHSVRDLEVEKVQPHEEIDVSWKCEKFCKNCVRLINGSYVTTSKPKITKGIRKKNT